MKKILIVGLSIFALSSAAFAAEHVIDQKGKQFVPKSITAKVGDTIRFRNSDPFAHNAYTEDSKNAFDIGMQSPGEDKVVTIKAKGKFTVGCNIHPMMNLQVTAE